MKLFLFFVFFVAFAAAEFVYDESSFEDGSGDMSPDMSCNDEFIRCRKETSNRHEFHRCVRQLHQCLYEERKEQLRQRALCIKRCYNGFDGCRKFDNIFRCVYGYFKCKKTC
uniref:Uncharacterized protein n=1 Tax=Clytia hemisphaerica TaxID=252671 RepID=A0A7M5VG97_9CNID